MLLKKEVFKMKEDEYVCPFTNINVEPRFLYDEAYRKQICNSCNICDYNIPKIKTTKSINDMLLQY